MKIQKLNKKGFTLIEMLVGIIIFSIVIIGGFYALSAVTLGKTKLIEETDIAKEAIYFTEKLFNEIKVAGTIDYEEYFNRKVVGLTMNSGHYATETGFGNFGLGGGIPGTVTTDYGNSFYFCRSTTTPMGNNGCWENSNNEFNTYNGGNNTEADNQISEPQRYGEYAFQFIDYNSDKDGDYGDENNDGELIGDDDDEYLGEGPTAFTGGTNVKELYLISGDNRKRTIFRWTVKEDPDKPTSATCNTTTAIGNGCLGTIEFLKLRGEDYGYKHDKSSTGTYNGIIDTWYIDSVFVPDGGEIIAGTNTTDYWQPLFPDHINVEDFKVFPYPNVNIDYAWKDFSDSANISPYVRVQMKLKPSWKKRKGIKGNLPSVKIATTINLSDDFSK